MILTPADIDALLAALRAQGSPLPDHLAPGLDDATMDRLTAPAGLVLPAEARAWWGYADGVPRSAPDGASSLGPVWWWAPLAEAVSEQRRIRATVLEVYEEDEPHPWRSSWLPPVIGEAGLAIDTTDPVRAPVFLVDLKDAPDDEPEPLLPTLGALVRAWTTALEAGAARFDATVGVIVPDDARVAALGLPPTIF